MYTGNYRTLLKEGKEDTNKVRSILCPWPGSFNTVQMSIPPKAIHRLSAIHVKILMVFCVVFFVVVFGFLSLFFAEMEKSI